MINSLLTDEEIFSAFEKVGYQHDSIYFRNWDIIAPIIAKAQHLKTLKAVVEYLEEGVANSELDIFYDVAIAELKNLIK
jgi:hypothetical protein